MTSPLWHPFTQHGLSGPAINIDRAEGAHLFTREGRKITDAISSWWVNTHGHCHPKIAAAVKAQVQKLEQVIFAGFTHDPAETLAQKLLHHAGPDFTHVFLSDSGSTSVEVALKMALGYWARHNKPRKRIVALDHGYHGDTFGAMSAGGRGPFTRDYESYLFDVTRLPFPEEGVESRTIDKFETILIRGEKDVAALILEPLLLGAGGMKTYSPELLKTLKDLCEKYGVLLIADEVLTGFGRTGTMFACQQAGVIPDIMCLSKGLTGGFLPMGATLCAEKIYKAFYSKDRGKMFFHSSSFAGNALSCAAAVANLDIWETEPVLERVAAISKSHAAVLPRFSKRPDVENARQLGSIFALDVKTPEDGDEGYLFSLAPRLYDFFLAKDVLLRPLGNTVYIMPPYCISPEDLAHVYDVIELALILSGMTANNGRLEAPVKSFLQQIVKDVPTHAKFMNMLSMLEHMGSRKIMISQMNRTLTEDILKHLAEEARHAYFFKRQAERAAKKTLDGYTDENTFCKIPAAMYFGRLDAGLTKRLDDEKEAYPWVSLIIELRACWLYAIYQQVLEESKLSISLKSLLAEEDLHLAEMFAMCGDNESRLKALSAYETDLFGKLFSALQTELSQSRHPERSAA